MIAAEAISYHRLDDQRRLVGRVLQAAGMGPQTTPSAAVLERPEFVLRAYGTGRVPVLAVPAPIKRSYIWDLLPEVSVVRHLRDSGHAVFLIDWKPPRQDQQDMGLAHYVAVVRGCIEAVAAVAGRPPVVAGHSLGGTLAVLAAAAAPRALSALVMLEAPVAFAGRAGAFAPAVASLPRADLVTERLGNVPGLVLSTSAVAASPETFVIEPFIDWSASLANPESLRIHMAVRRWMFDESPFAARLFEDVIEDLYRADLFMRGQLDLGSGRLDPALPIPTLSVHDPENPVVPPKSVLPLHRAVRHSKKRRISISWEPGVVMRHLTPLVGPDTHRRVWPDILHWISAL